MVNFSLEDADVQPRRGGLGLGSIVLIIGVVLTVLVFGYALIQRNQTQPTSGPAPDFVLTTFTGDTVRLVDLRGKVVVVNFWASWCGPCRDEAPALENVSQRYADQNVVVVGIAYTDTETNSRAFIDEFNITYPNGPDIGTRISDRYNIQGVPETFVIDKNGNIVQFFMLPLTEAELSAAIDRALSIA